MKVKLAVQTLSSSVADAFEFFRNLNVPDFLILISIINYMYKVWNLFRVDLGCIKNIA